MGRLKYLDLVADDSLHPGDCLVEGPQSQVDATLATRRQKIFSSWMRPSINRHASDLQAALDEALDEALAEPPAAAPPQAQTPPVAAIPAPQSAPPAPAAETLPQTSDLEDW